jgi:hypothetical protein
MTDGTSSQVRPDAVYGCNLGCARDGSFLVARFDLGISARAVRIPKGAAIWMLDNIPISEGLVFGGHYPILEPEDWDGARTPSVVKVRAVEMEGRLVLLLELQDGSEANFYLPNMPRWTFTHQLRSYEPQLRSQRASGML